MVEAFEGLEDWRNAQQTRHRLSELLTLAVCAVLSGADDFEDILQWGRAKLDWLRGFRELDYGVASADTFDRVFALLDPHRFQRAARCWVGAVIPALAHEHVNAIDGKTSRRTTSKAAAAPLHMVSAFAAEEGIVLCQTETAKKSNEITAIPELPATLDIADCIVTVDAMCTQTAIARQIRDQGGHYVLCVKDNQPKRLDSILLAHAGVGGKRTVERRHYISSLPPDAEKIAHAVRSHWEVENRLHLCLDVQFNADYARTGHVAHNLALVRHIALNLIRLDNFRKARIDTERLLAATSDEYRAELLGFEPDDEEDEG